MQLRIIDIIRTNFAVTTDDGDRIFDLLDQNFSKKTSVILDFEGITLMTTAFLNSSIGQLYSNNKYSSEFLNSNLKIVNVQEQDRSLFAIVVKRAKEYFADRQGFERNTSDSIYGSD